MINSDDAESPGEAKSWEYNNNTTGDSSNIAKTTIVKLHADEYFYYTRCFKNVNDYKMAFDGLLITPASKRV